MARKRRTYAREFKIEAVKLVTEQGYSVAEAARSLGLHETLLRATRANLAALRKRLEERVRQVESGPRAKEAGTQDAVVVIVDGSGTVRFLPKEPLAFMMVGTKNRELVPVACQILASRKSIEPASKIIDFIYARCEPAEASRHLVPLVDKMTWTSRCSL
jgi:transposase-like protein